MNTKQLDYVLFFSYYNNVSENVSAIYDVNNIIRPLSPTNIVHANIYVILLILLSIVSLIMNNYFLKNFSQNLVSFIYSHQYY